MLQRRRGGGGSSHAQDGNVSDPEDDQHGTQTKSWFKRWSIHLFLARLHVIFRSRWIRLLGMLLLLSIIVVIVAFPKTAAQVFKGKRGLNKPKGGGKQRGASTSPLSEFSVDNDESETEQPWSIDKLQSALEKVRSNFSEKSKPVTSQKLTIALSKPYRYNGHRSFGCMRDTCRGLEIEDLFDRGFHRYFRSALTNETSEGYNLKVSYRVTILLLDTTQLNHMKTVVPTLYKKIWENQASSTYVIAFEGGDAMGGNKGFQLRQKDRFTRKFNCDYNDLRVQPTQYRLYVKSECEALIERSQSDKSTSFLLKPEAGSQGQGITFHSSADEIIEKRKEFFPCETRHGIPATSRFLVQEYIARPLLLNKCKFDARVYLYASSADPYLLWYHRGYLRRSLTPYSPATRDRKAYLTNTHFQSSRTNFNMSEHIWTLDRMQSQLVKQKQAYHGFVESVVEPWMKEVALFVFESAREKIIPRRGSSQIIGLDFMLDDKLHLHFIEANGYPGFTWSVNFDTRGMVEDMVDLMTEQSETPGMFKFLRPGDRFGGFQLIHSDARPHRVPYDPCFALADNALLGRVVNSANRALVNITPKSNTDDAKLLPDEVISLVENFVSDARDSCRSFILETYDLWDKAHCAAFERREVSTSDGISTKTTTINAVVTDLSLKKQLPILFPSPESVRQVFMNQKVECDGTYAKRKRVQFIHLDSELRLPIEKVAYPNGRRPFPPFYKDGSKAMEMLQKGLDINGRPLDESQDFKPKKNDPVFARAERLFQLFPSEVAPNVVYRLRWFALFTYQHPMLMAFSYPGYAFSVRRMACSKEGFETWRKNEHAMDLDMFQDVLSACKVAPSRLVVSQIEPIVRRVLEHLIHKTSLREMLQVRLEKESPLRSSVFAMDWTIESSTLRPKLISIHPLSSNTNNIIDLSALLGEDADVEGIAEQTLKKLQQSRERLEQILRVAPTFFSRARRGDSFEGFRFVHNHLEFTRFDNLEMEMCQDSFPSKKEMDFAIDFENLHVKRKNAIHRDLNKRITKRWLVCRVKRNEEAKKSCIRPLLRERYRIIVRNQRLVSDEDRWIDYTFQGLADVNVGKGEDDDDRGSGRRGSDTGEDFDV